MNIDLESAGGLLSATLVAHEIEGQGAAAGHHSHASCANCDTALTGRFCHACGQRDHVHRSLLHLGEEFLHGLLHFDAKAWRTLPLLVARPGKLTREYIDGKRTRYVSPLALFLFMVFLMFFVVSSVSHTGGDEEPGSMAAATSGVDKALAKARGKLARANAEVAAAQVRGEPAGKAQARAEAAQADVKDEEEALSQVAAGLGKVAAASTPRSEDNDNVDTGWPKLDKAIKHAIKNPEFTLYKLKNAASKFSFLLVPISLPFLWLMFFWKRGVTMYDHAVFALYSLSFMSLLVTVLALLKMAGLKPLVVWLVFLAPPVHMFVQLRGTYMLGRASTLWRTAVLLCVAGTVLTLYLLLILMLSMAG